MNVRKSNELNVDAEQLARIMYQARCDEIGCSTDEATLLSGDDHHQYMEYAQQIADFVNNYDVEAQAVAKYILNRMSVSVIEAISSGPPSRVLP